MKRLILFRHAKTERTSASGEDFDRALTERGKADTRENRQTQRCIPKCDQTVHALVDQMQ